MNKEFFKPEDFLDTKGVYIYPAHTLANIANKKLQELIESWPVVYSKHETGSPYYTTKYPNDTHKALLAFIEPIVKEPCKHKSIIFNKKVYGNEAEMETKVIDFYSCADCGVELIEKWEEKK